MSCSKSAAVGISAGLLLVQGPDGAGAIHEPSFGNRFHSGLEVTLLFVV